MALLSYLLEKIAASYKLSLSAYVLSGTEEQAALGPLTDQWSITACDDLQGLVEAVAGDRTEGLMIVVTPLRLKLRVGAAPSGRARPEEAPSWQLLRAAMRGQGLDRYVGAFVPGRLLSSPKQRALRELLAQAMYPRIVVEGAAKHFLGSSDGAAEELTEREGLGALVVFGDGRYATGPTRFFVLPSEDDFDAKTVVTDMRKLLEQPHGRTRYGWVYEDDVDTAQSLGASGYSPEVTRLRGELAELGDVVCLNDIAELLGTVDRDLVTNAPILTRSVPVLQGREIETAGRVRPVADRLLAAPTEVELLREGDICIRRTVPARDERLAVTEVEATWLPLAAADDVAVIRLTSAVEDALRPFVVDYLRSPRALHLLRSERRHVTLRDEELGGIQIPLPTEALKIALIDLWQAENATIRFLQEIRHVRSSLVASIDEAADAAIPRVLRAGRLIRQRLAAAEGMNYLSTRLRQQLPYPLAHLWRSLETTERDSERYDRVLELAEAVTLYLATLAIVSAREAKVQLKVVADIATQLATTSHGMSFGAWSAIVDEVQTEGFRERASSELPIPELAGCLSPKSEPAAALMRLRQRRNDHAHGKGPRGADVSKQIGSALRDLATLMEATEFLTEYPLRAIETTRWDSLETRNIYSYRDLMGDHPLVNQAHGVSSRADLEANSLYVVDRRDDLLLLRPLLQRETCDLCEMSSIFVFDRPLSGDACGLRSLDHGHTIERAGLRAGLVSMGLLPPSAS